MTRKIIINADDAGISSCVNKAIVQGTRAGRISAASVMPNMPFAEEAVSLFHESRESCPDIGLHFCLTSGKPMTPCEKIPMLVNEHGNFNVGFLSLWYRFIRHKHHFLEQVERELEAQLHWFDKRKIPLRFLDSHQHIHMIPGIFELVGNAAKKRGLFLRIPDEKIGGFSRFVQRLPVWMKGGLIKKTLLTFLSSRSRRKHRENSRFRYFGILDTGCFSLPAWKALLRKPIFNQKEIALVNIHPALKESQTLQATDVCCSSEDMEFLRSPQRFEEWNVLFSREFQELCQKEQIQISGFP